MRRVGGLHVLGRVHMKLGVLLGRPAGWRASQWNVMLVRINGSVMKVDNMLVRRILWHIVLHCTALYDADRLYATFGRGGEMHGCTIMI